MACLISCAISTVFIIGMIYFYNITDKSAIVKFDIANGKEMEMMYENPDVDVSFQYLRMFFEQDDKKLEKIEKEYRSGKLLTGELKAILIEKINTFLKEHQRKREEAKKLIDKFLFRG